MITNPTPVTTSTFSGMWITQLQIFFKPGGLVQASLLPWDGTHLLATGGQRVMKRETDLTPAVKAALVAEVKRLAENKSEPKMLTVSAPDATKPVTAQVAFEDGTFHRIADCFALAAKDAAFAGVLNSLMTDIARLAGLAVK